jgi:hypothetical protein
MSVTQSIMGMGGASVIELKDPTRDCESHALNHGVKDSGYCGGA